jgi:hypothetical protein
LLISLSSPACPTLSRSLGAVKLDRGVVAALYGGAPCWQVRSK